jgi:hypothetical protein
MIQYYLILSLSSHARVPLFKPLFRDHTISNPRPIRAPIPQSPGTGSCTSPDADPPTPCLIQKSWMFFINTGSGSIYSIVKTCFLRRRDTHSRDVTLETILSRHTSSRISPHRAPFANRTILFSGRGEFVSTAIGNSQIHRYFQKIPVFRGLLPCKIAGHKRSLFSEGVKDV